MKKIALPKIVQTFWFVINPVSFLRFFDKKLGSLFEMNLIGGRSFICVSDPSLSKLFLKEYRETSFDEVSFIFGDSAPTLKGCQHKERRGIVAPCFNSNQISLFDQSLYLKVSNHLDKIEQGQNYPINELTRDITLEIMVEFIFNSSKPKLKNEMKSAAIDLSRQLGGTGIGIFFNKSKYKKNLKRIDNVVTQLLQECDKGNYDNDNSGIIYQLYSSGLDASSIRSEIITLVGAGIESAAAAVSWSLIYLDENSKIKISEEIKSSKISDFSYESLKHLKYLDAFCKEVLRIMPINTYYERKIDHDSCIEGVNLKKGGQIFILPIITHYKDAIYSAPQQFIPERFLKESFSVFEYSAFGAENRFCLGSKLAYFMMKITIINTIDKFEDYNVKEPFLNYKHMKFGNLYPNDRTKLTFINNNKHK